MKKFWNLMLVALVIMGAAACTETDESVEQQMNAGVSFYATIGNDTRAYIDNADGDKTWNTIWEENDRLIVWNVSGGANYTFVCVDAEAGKFTCSDSNAAELFGNNVAIISDPNYHDMDSRLGKKALLVNTYDVPFAEDANIQLTSQTSFLRYNYEGDGDVTLRVDLEVLNNDVAQTQYVFVDNGMHVNEITFSDVKGENIVPFWCGVESVYEYDATLSYFIDGVKVKEATINNIGWGKVYNLGTLAEPTLSAYSVPGTHNDWTAGNTPMYVVGDYCVAYNVTFAADGAFKILGNDKWLGANSLTVGKWTAAGEEYGDDIYVPAGTYDIYFSEAESKVCVVVAGSEVPAMPVFSIGVVGLGGNWDVDRDMTLEGEYYTLKGVAIAATDTFKLRVSDDWAENYGIASSSTAESEAINVDAMYTLVQDGKNMQVAAGTYDLYFDYETKRFYVMTVGTTPDDLAIPQYKIYVYQYNNTWTKVNLYSWDSLSTNYTGAWPGTATTAAETINGYEYLVWTMDRAATGTTLNIILNDGTTQTSDFALGQLNKDYYLLLNGTALSFIEDPENPEPEVIEGEPQPSTWALAGDFNSWGEQVMYTTDTTNVFVATNVKITAAYQKIKVKQVGNWNNSYGGGFQYLNANSYMTVSSGGSDIYIVTAGTYDVYFDFANKHLYVVTAGADRMSAVKQTTEGPAPDLSSSSWGLCGSHNNWGTNDTPLVWDGTISMYVAKSVKLTGEFKVRADKAWSTNYGSGNTITVNATAGTTVYSNGGNCKVASGTYDVYFDLSAKKVWVKTPGSAAPTK